MMRYPHITARLFNTPLLIHPAKLDAIVAGLSGRFGLGEAERPEPSLFTTAAGERRDPGYRVLDSGVAVLDVFGVLAHRGRIEADSSYVLGYQDLARQFDAAINDPAVRAIVKVYATPGGEVAGAFDLADTFRAARGRKPMVAVVSDLAASAGYLLASAADEIVVTQTGYAGSIGVVMRHVDFSQALNKDGIQVTHIFAGDRKVDGHPYGPLPEAVRESFQSEINALYELFIDTVAANTGMSTAAVRATQAAMYRGHTAVKAGLATRVATPDYVIAEMATQFSRRAASVRITTQRGTAMIDDKPDAGFTQADMDQARADGARQGRTEAAARIESILSHAEAVGREAQAKVLAFATELTAEQATKVLAASPASAPTPSAETFNPFLAAMANVANPKVSVLGGDEDGDEDEVARVLAFAPKQLAR